MTWKRGPLPPDTWNWGGVVPVGEETSSGFYFADFHGTYAEVDVVRIGPGGLRLSEKRVVEAKDVAWYNNSLELPPKG